MIRYIFLRILGVIGVLLAISLITFFLMHSIPGGPWDELKMPLTGVQRQTSGMFLNAGILPAVNFTRVEEVVVLAPQPAASVPTRVDSQGRR